MKILNFIVVIVLLLNFSIKAQNVISADSLKKHVYFLASDSLAGRGLGTPEGLKAANYIANYFQNLGLKPLDGSYLQPFFYEIDQTVVQGNNVIGIIEGSDPVLKDEYILLGAHYDHVAYRFKNGKKVIYNGADDNATGTAAVIELSRNLIKNKSQLKRSIILAAFDGEESGLIGSYRFVNNGKIPMDQIKLMMSIDMIGKFDRSNSLIMGAMASLVNGDEMLEPLAKKHNIEIKKTGKKVSNRTDSKPFGYEAIPALHVTSGIIQPYHKPEDDPSDIDYNGMGKISDLLFDLTSELANTNELKPIKKLERAKKHGLILPVRFGIKANIGSSYLNYTNESYNSKRMFSPELGVFSQLKINNYIALQPELLLSGFRTKHELGDIESFNVTTPVSLVLASYMNQIYESRAYLLIGGYYSYGFSNTIDGSPSKYKQDFNSNDYGTQLGLGFEVTKIHLSFTYRWGLSELNKVNNKEVKTRAAYFSLGYIF